MSGRSAPSDAAFTGFAGTRSTSHRENDGMLPALSTAEDPAADALSRMLAIAAGSSGMALMSGGAMTAAYAAAANNVVTKNAMADRPTRPIARASGALVMPTMRLPTTRGMTVMRIALIQIVPTGSSVTAARARPGDPLLATATPAAMPAASAMRTRVVSDMARI